MAVHVAMLAHRAVPALLARRLTVISRVERLITDGPSSVGEVVMIGAGRIEHRELNYYTSEKRHFLVHLRLDHVTVRASTVTNVTCVTR